MSLLLIVIVLAIELRLTIVSSVKVYRSYIVTIGGLIPLSVVVISDKVVRLSFPSSVNDYRSVDKLLALTLYFSLVESIIDTYYKLDIFGELAKAIYSSNLIFNFFFKTLVELGNISIIVLI